MVYPCVDYFLYLCVSRPNKVKRHYTCGHGLMAEHQQDYSCVKTYAYTSCKKTTHSGNSFIKVDYEKVQLEFSVHSAANKFS